MQILFLSRWFPYPTNNGAKLRIFHLLRGLSAAHEVTLIAFTDPPVPAQFPEELRAICRDIRAVVWKEFQPRSQRALSGFFDRKPRSLADTFSVEMEREIQQAVSISSLRPGDLFRMEYGSLQALL